MTEHRSSDPPHHWTLRTALAVVIPAPAYIYDPIDPNYHERYNSLVSTVKEDVQQSAASLSGMQIESPLNPEWYRVIRPHTGGMFPSLVEVITIVKDVNDVVQPFASWASIAELALRLMRNWIARNQANPGFDRNKDRLIFFTAGSHLSVPQGRPRPIRDIEGKDQLLGSRPGHGDR